MRHQAVLAAHHDKEHVVGAGRVFYSSLGHRDDIWAHDPVFRAHMVGGIRWALGLER